MLNNLRNFEKKSWTFLSPPPPPHTNFRSNYKGRRSQEGFTLNSFDLVKLGFKDQKLRTKNQKLKATD